MPTWWIVGAAIYVPLFLCGVVAGVREGDDPWTALWVTPLYLGVNTAVAVWLFR
jgi:hypothetical protein